MRSTAAALALPLAVLGLLGSAAAEHCPLTPLGMVGKYEISACAVSSEDTVAQRLGYIPGFVLTDSTQKKSNKDRWHFTSESVSTSPVSIVTRAIKLEAKVEKLKKAKTFTPKATPAQVRRLQKLSQYNVCFKRIDTAPGPLPAWFVAMENIIRQAVESGQNEEVFRLAGKKETIVLVEQAICQTATKSLDEVNRAVRSVENTAENIVVDSNVAADVIKRFFRDMPMPVGDVDFKKEMGATLVGGVATATLAEATSSIPEGTPLRKMIEHVFQLFNFVTTRSSKMGARALLCASSPAMFPLGVQLRVAAFCNVNEDDATALGKYPACNLFKSWVDAAVPQEGALSMGAEQSSRPHANFLIRTGAIRTKLRRPRPHASTESTESTESEYKS